MPNWYSTLSDQKCLDPGALAAGLAQIDHPFRDDLPLWRRANSYTCPLGKTPGVAYVLLQRSHLEQLEPNDYHTLIFRDDRGELEIPNLLIVWSKSMFGRAGDASSPMLVKLEDKRCVLARSTVNKTYNDRKSRVAHATDATNYYTASLNAGSLWTWQGVITNLWTFLTEGGTAPTLPYTPDDRPENLRFLGGSAWEAVHVVLDQIGCTTGYDPLLSEFIIVRQGEEAGAYGQKSDLYEAGRLLLDFDPLADFNAGTMPATVRVFFPSSDPHAAAHSEDVATGITGAKGVLGVWSTAVAVPDPASPGDFLNQNQLTDLAQQMADNVELNTMQLKKWVFIGAENSLLPNSEISCVTWRDYGDGVGLVTEVERECRRPELPASVPLAESPRGGVARLTSAMSAASGTTTRTFGSGTADIYRRNGSNQSELLESGVTIYNSTTQTGASGDWIQFKVDDSDTYLWDVGDC